MKIKDLLEYCEIPRYSHSDPKGKGYQRIPKKARLDAVRDRFAAQPDNPEALLDNINLNIRDARVEKTYCKPLAGEKPEPGHAHVLEIVEGHVTFWVVDGQTRLLGAQKAIDHFKDEGLTKSVEELENTLIGINLTFNEDFMKEAYIFYLLNQYSKNLPADGAIRLMVDGHDGKSPEFTNEITTKRKESEVGAMKVVEKLSRDSEVWVRRIREYNQEGDQNTIISARALALTIKPIYAYFQQLKQNPGDKSGLDTGQPAEVITHKIVEAFWCGLSDIFPDMFHPQKRTFYNIMKSSQAEVMMKILYYMLEGKYGGALSKLMGSLIQRSTYSKLLHPVLTNFADANASNQRTTGQKCWLAGKDGSMGKYTSAQAKKEITTKLIKAFEKHHKVA